MFVKGDLVVGDIILLHPFEMCEDMELYDNPGFDEEGEMENYFFGHTLKVSHIGERFFRAERMDTDEPFYPYSFAYEWVRVKIVGTNEKHDEKYLKEVY